MKLVCAALVLSLGLVGPAFGQGVPSDVEDKLGLRKNASPAEVERALSDFSRSGRRLPPDTERKLQIWFRQQRAGGGSGRGYNEGDLRDRCERRAERRGLRGYEFRQYVRSCLERD
jgi:hypothetical protein